MYCGFDVSALFANEAGDHNLRLRCEIYFRKSRENCAHVTGAGRSLHIFKVILPLFHLEDSCYLCILGKLKFYTRSLSLQFHRMLRNPAIEEIGTPVW